LQGRKKLIVIAATLCAAWASVAGAAGVSDAAAPSARIDSPCHGPFPLKPPHFNRHQRHVDDRWAGSTSPMARDDIRLLLRAVWSKLYKRCHRRALTSYGVHYRVRRNLRQIASDSGYVPAAVSPVGNHNKGLLQINDHGFRVWSIPGHHDVFHPLDDLMAAVNIQLNCDTLSVVDGFHYRHDILDGRHGGWGAHCGDNPWHPFR
jgi:hypothetical protein